MKPMKLGGHTLRVHPNGMTRVDIVLSPTKRDIKITKGIITFLEQWIDQTENTAKNKKSRSTKERALES